MPTPTFVPLSPAMTEARVGAASSQSGLMVGEAVASTSNACAMLLRASGTPTAATSLNIALQRGGYSTGPYTEDTGTPDTGVLDDCIESAEADINSRIGKRYATPVVITSNTERTGRYCCIENDCLKYQWCIYQIPSRGVVVVVVGKSPNDCGSRPFKQT